MQTQIVCPRCQTPFTAEVHQLVDAQRTPELKQMLLSGTLNVAECPRCGAGTQMAAPMAYHDSEHQLFMIYVPMELNLPMAEQQRLIGQMTKAITADIPPQQFKAYLLQPQNIITMKTFLEKVFATEGITPEMLEQQRQQMVMLQQLMSLPTAAAMREMVQQNMQLVDEQLFAIVQSTLQNAIQNPAAEAQVVALSNLQAWLYTETELGRELEKRQLVMRQLQRDAKEQGGLTTELFAQYLIANKGDEGTLAMLIQAGQQGISYELLMLIAAELDKAQLQNNTAEIAQLSKLRELLVGVYEEMEQESQKVMAQAQQTLEAILQAPNPTQAVQQHLGQIDEAFMYNLSIQLAQAEQNKDAVRQLALRNIHSLIIKEAENQLPPELRLINQLIRLPDEAAQRQIINQLPADARPQLAQLLQAVGAQMAENGDEEMLARVVKLQAMVG